MRILWAIFGIKMYTLWYLHPSAKTKKTKAAALPMLLIVTKKNNVCDIGVYCILYHEYLPGWPIVFPSIPRKSKANANALILCLL